MTILTHPVHHISIRTTTLAFAGAVLAGGVGFGVAAVVIDEAVPAPPPPGVGTPSGTDISPIPDPNGFLGTNREERALMHRLAQPPGR